jgi:hypothetical protein
LIAAMGWWPGSARPVVEAGGHGAVAFESIDAAFHEVARLVDAGVEGRVNAGRRVGRAGRHRRAPDPTRRPADPVYYVVIPDPEGNKFCVS